MAFDLDGARKAGYSDDEIIDYLSKQNRFDASGALKSGYQKDEVINHLMSIETMPKEQEWKFKDGIVNTLKNIGKVYPAFETAANLATSTYGVPISGLVGLAALPFGADTANDAINAVQKFLVYQPQTKGGEELTQAATYPLQELDKLAGAAGSKVADVTGPTAGALVHGAIDTLPAAFGAKSALGSKAYVSPKLGATVEQGINKAIRPSVSKKEVWSQREKYMQNAQVAVDEIIKNKENLRLVDREGAAVTGKLPETLQEFSQAIEQTKKRIYEEYNDLAKQADSSGANVSMVPVVAELDPVINNKVMQTMSPETIAYAQQRQKALSGKQFSPTEVQEMIQMLNQSEKAFYSNPSPEMQGRAYVDSLIANNLRAGLDATIESATGWEYQPLKRKYGALRMLETDVTKRAIVDARKNIRGLIDFSDVFSGSQVVQGLTSANPSMVASGAAARGVASLIKYINDPNRIVKSMFRKSEKYNMVVPGREPSLTPGLVYGSSAGQTEYQGD